MKQQKKTMHRLTRIVCTAVLLTGSSCSSFTRTSKPAPVLQEPQVYQNQPAAGYYEQPAGGATAQSSPPHPFHLRYAGQAEFYVNRAMERSEIGDLEGAIGDLTHALTIAPDAPAVYTARALLYERLGWQAEASADRRAAAAVQ